MGRTIQDHHAELLKSLPDRELYAAAHIAALGLETGVWAQKDDPKRRAAVFRQTLSKLTKKMGEPDGFRIYPKQGRLAAWQGLKWKKAAGLA